LNKNSGISGADILRLPLALSQLNLALVSTHISQGTAIIPHPVNQAQQASSLGVPLADVLNDVIPMPPSWDESPCLQDDSKATDISQWCHDRIGKYLDSAVKTTWAESN
jgi:hypothetical protein